MKLNCPVNLGLRCTYWIPNPIIKRSLTTVSDNDNNKLSYKFLYATAYLLLRTYNLCCNYDLNNPVKEFVFFGFR